MCKILKRIFTSKFLQWMFSRIHPNTAVGLAHRWSRHSRLSKDVMPPFLGDDKEHLILYSKKVLEKEHYDFFVYGHRHIPMEISLNENAKLSCLGDWFYNFTYGVFYGKNMEVKKYSF